MYTSPAKIIQALSLTSSRLEKEAILERVLTNLDNEVNLVFAAGFCRALDTYETFGVKDVAQVYHDNGGELSEDWTKVRHLLNDLSNRTLTGNAAAEAIANVSLSVDDVEWNIFYSSVLKKDMRCGVSVATWNKVAKKHAKHMMVNTFSCQLAHDGAKLDKIEGKKIVEVKLDGVRVISIVHPDGRVDMFSRNGKRLDNFPKIAETLSKYAIDTPFVLDGEVMSSSFQDLMKQVHRKDNVQTDDAVLYLFDIISHRMFRQGKDTAPQRVRSEILKNTIGVEDNVKVVQQTLIDLDTDEGKKQFADINRSAIDRGYEGIMLKDPEAPYETKRTKSWLKIKPVIEVTLEVIAIEEGTGKNKGSTGALVCRGTDTGREITVNVGSGLTDDMRTSIWLNTRDVLGQLVEVKADAITQNQDGSYSLRFPRFKCFRGFAPGEKL